MIAASPNPPHRLVPFSELENKVIRPGLCTHCGTCVGLAQGALAFAETEKGPRPVSADLGAADPMIPKEALEACPGQGLDYPELNEYVFGGPPSDWLAGRVRRSYLAYASDPNIRRSGASAGVITQLLLSLLASGRIDGAVTLRHGEPRPWLSTPVVAHTPDQIRAGSQSVYVPIPVNQILGEIGDTLQSLAYVGLPDQVASLRKLQQLGEPRATKIQFVIGPYVGTSMYVGSIRSFIRSNGVDQLDDIELIRYRDGEWPGSLLVRTRQGRELRSPKFYYNYLIPFYVTRASLLTMDFTNELTDISVGDAWAPELEDRGEGYSVVLARSAQAVDLLSELAGNGAISLEEIPLEQALGMHGHMLDFKKRGAYLRAQARRLVGLPAPDFGIRPTGIPFSRVLVELVVSGIFLIGSFRVSRWIIEQLPPDTLGPLFDTLRTWWKGLSKPAKRRGLSGQVFLATRRGEYGNPQGPGSDG